MSGADDLMARRQMRAMLDKLQNPMWMAAPRSWIWAGPQGPQGPGLLVDHEPGLANLMWLAIGFDRPPATFNAMSHTLLVMLMVGGSLARLDGEPLLDVAAVSTLQEFHDKLAVCGVPPGATGVEKTYPLLKLLAARRLYHADT